MRSVFETPSLALWSLVPLQDPRTQKQLEWLSKWLSSDPKKGQKWLKSGRKPLFESLLALFGVTWASTPQSHFWESLLGHVNCLGVLGSLGDTSDHRFILVCYDLKHVAQVDTHNQQKDKLTMTNWSTTSLDQSIHLDGFCLRAQTNKQINRASGGYRCSSVS